MMRVISFLALPALLLAQGDPLVNGLAAFHQGDYVKAEREFRSALKTGEDPRARTFLALTLAETNRCDAAEVDLTKALDGSAPELKRLSGLALAQCSMTR